MNRRKFIKLSALTAGAVIGGQLLPDYTKFEEIFKGKIKNWSRRGDELTFNVADDLVTGVDTKLPEAQTDGLQYIDYRNTNVVDVMLDLISKTEADPAIVKTSKFNSEKATWLSSFVVNRVII